MRVVTQLGPEYKTGLEDDLESGTNDEITQ